MAEPMTKEIFLLKSKEIHGDKYDYSKVVIKNTGGKNKVIIICPSHGEFKQVRQYHTSGSGCPRCGKESFNRNGKIIFSEDDEKFLRENYPEFPLARCSIILKIDRNAVKTKLKQMGLYLPPKPTNKPYKEFPTYFWSGVESSAKARNLELEVTVEYLWELYYSQEKKCALSGWPLRFCKDSVKTTASLDRIDSEKGYIEGNLQFIYKQINKCKLNCPEDFFYAMCEAVYLHRKDMRSYRMEMEEYSYLDTELPKLVRNDFNIEEFIPPKTTGKKNQQ